MMHVTSKAKAFSKMTGLKGDEKTWPGLEVQVPC